MKFADTNWSFWLKHQTLKQRSLCPWFFLGRIFAWFLSQKIQKGKGKNPKIQENYKSYGLSKKVLSNLKWQTFKWLVHFFQKWNKRGKKKSTFQNTISMQNMIFLMQLVWENERFSSSFSTSYRKSKYILIFLKNYTLLVRWWQNFSFKSCSINMLVIFFFKSLTNYDLSLPSPFGPKLQLRGLLGLESGFG